MQSKFMTKREAAEYLKVSLRQIDIYIEDGALTQLKAPTGAANSAVRLYSSEVENFFVKKPASLTESNKPEGKRRLFSTKEVDALLERRAVK